MTRIEKAALAMEKIMTSFATANNFISAEDLPMIQKYIALGVIKMSRKTTPLQKGLYKPALEHEAMKDLPYTAWLYMFHHYANKYQVKCALSKSQVAEYVFNAARYQMLPVVAGTTAQADEYIKEFKEYINVV